MNRSIVYDEEQADPFDLLWQYRDMLAALGGAVVSLTGSTSTVTAGFAAAQTSPLSLTINMAQGWVYQQSPLDSTNYGALPSDSTIVEQQGFTAAQSVTLSTAGLTSGQSMWALIQAQFSQTDVVRPTDPTGGVLNYFNSNNPTQPFQGPNNNGQSQPTERKATVAIQVLYGTPASTGSEVPPNPTSGWVPLYLIDLAFSQTTIANGQILVAGPSVGANVPSNYPAAPFIGGLLRQHHLGNGNGQAPQIDLTLEVKNTLPLSNLPASNTSGGGVPVLKLRAGNPNGNVAGNASVNGASDLCYDTVNFILYVCTATGSTSTAVWTSVVGSSTSIFAGGTSTGSANAQVVASTSPAGFTKSAGQVVSFTAGFTNTGSATLNVDGTGASTIQKNTGSGNVNLTGGEIAASAFVSVLWTGTVYLLQAGLLGALATLNIGAWLKNDGAGNLTIKNGALLGDDGSGNFNILNTAVTPATYTRPKLTVSASGQITSAASGAQSTFSQLTVGTGLYTTKAGCKRLRIRMWAAGAGGGGSANATSNPGAAGSASQFGSTTVNGGAPGNASAGVNGGAGGAGGVGGSTGTGTEISRFAGQSGGYGGAATERSGTPLYALSGYGGSSGPAAGGGQSVEPGAGQNGVAPGCGGSGGSCAVAGFGAAGGGGGGEFVEFFINSPASTYAFTMGAKGLGGTSPNSAGGNGTDGLAIVEELYD